MDIESINENTEKDDKNESPLADINDINEDFSLEYIDDKIYLDQLFGNKCEKHDHFY